MTKFSNVRAVLSGSVLELFVYEKKVAYDFNIEPAERSIDLSVQPSEQEKILTRIRSLQRTKSTLRRIVHANSYEWSDIHGEICKTKFVTLTFAENIQTVQEANPCFTNFMKRLNYRIHQTKKSKLQYVLVPEFQKRGAVHYHAIYFNLPWFGADLLADTWAHGFVRINQIAHINNIGSYIAKYIGKDMNDHRLAGQKHYFTSRGLKRPIFIKDPATYAGLHEHVADLPITYASEFDSDMHGHVRYSLIDLSEYSLEKQKVLESLKLQP